MGSAISAFPLQWPPAWKRTPGHLRERSRFHQKERQTRTWNDGSTSSWQYRKDASVAVARRRLADELDRMGASSVVLSSNVELRLDGLPYSNRKEPEDPGAAVYFMLDRKQLCIPCDKWDRVADNIIAIAKTVEALRGLERWGAKSMVEAAFSGFKALPDRGSGTPWWEILGVDSSASSDEIRKAWKRLSVECHPDKEGGDEERFKIVNEAFRQGLASVCVGH